jgi:hypothetical protein
MELQDTTAPQQRWAVWAGRILTTFPILMMAMSASMKLGHGPQAVQMFVNKLGYGEHLLAPLAAIELACIAIYAIPRTAILGAILLTAYLGGAVATHVRVGDGGFLPAIIIAVLAWAALFLRDERLRALLPLRHPTRTGS